MYKQAVILFYIITAMLHPVLEYRIKKKKKKKKCYLRLQRTTQK